MRVVVNALGVPSFKQGGASFYTAMLVNGLSRSADSVSLTALVSETLAAELGEAGTPGELITARDRRASRLARLANQIAARRHPWQLDVGFDAVQCPTGDVVHWPISFMHAPPPPASAKKVLTLHDLQHEHFPQFFSRRDLALRRARWRPSALAADQVLTVSEFSKQSIQHFYGLDANRITVSHLPPRPSLLDSLVADRPCEPPDELADTQPWFVYPASPLPAKNHIRLIEAFATFRARHHRSAKLVLTGPDLHTWESIEREITERHLGDAVLVLKHVSDRELASLYQSATGLIFPSLFEGFGLPIVEAMAAGCPMAIAGAGSLQEVAGGVGHTFAPDDTEAIIAALQWLVDLNEPERQAQAMAGRQRAGTFTQQKMIEATLEAYRTALSGA